ncbi:MAG: tagaturonate reductase [Lachnospiraceae bacterium]|nr:tagaturonate reductase [Lachnospiraceae bacterium]
MRRLNKEIVSKPQRPVKVLQYGEGNFLRAFVDYMFDICNEEGSFDGSIVMVKPTNRGGVEKYKAQDNLYNVSLRGLVDGKATVTNRVITSIHDTISPYEDYEGYVSYAHEAKLEYIVSNTTEAGIVWDEADKWDINPSITFPGKLTKFLYERFTFFNGNKDKGLIILPVELIDDNGKVLLECVNKYIDLWGLSLDFKTWVNESCEFCSTLVDRIVSGFPKGEEEKLYEELGYEDELFTVGEPFALWVIESKLDLKERLPFTRAGLPVVYTDDLKPYKKRKVRILNGAHTSFVLASYLAGNDIVLESMKDKLIYDFMKDTLYKEVIPTLTLDKKDLEDFAEAVIERFENPFVKHALLSISLNSVSKWKARCMPSLLDYISQKNELPLHLTFSLAALMAFYSSTELKENALVGKRGNEEYPIKDDLSVLEFFKEYSTKDTKEFVHAFLSNEEFWGQDLSTLLDIEERVCAYLEKIRLLGMRETLTKEFAH